MNFIGKFIKNFFLFSILPATFLISGCAPKLSCNYESEDDKSPLILNPSSSSQANSHPINFAFDGNKKGTSFWESKDNYPHVVKLNYSKETIINSVKKTGRLAVVDPGWQSFGASAEIITSVIEKYSNYLKASPIRINFPDSHTPMSQNLEKKYYIDEQKIVERIKENFKT